MRIPSFQFYPDAWMSDMGLRSCSPAARGLWADLLCLMHQGTPYGHLRLQAGGEFFVPDDAALARIAGAKPAQVRKWIAELEAKGVVNRAENGTIFSRKMVRDGRKREQWRERQSRKRSKPNSNEVNTDERSVTRDTPRDVTRDVTPPVTQPSPRSPSPTPSPTPNTSAEAEVGVPDFSPTDESVWWDENRGELGCEQGFEDGLFSAYDDATEAWIAERWTYHSRWLRDHAPRLKELITARGLAVWVKNRIREDYARDVTKPRTADEILAAGPRNRQRKDGDDDRA